MNIWNTLLEILGIHSNSHITKKEERDNVERATNEIDTEIENTRKRLEILRHEADKKT